MSDEASDNECLHSMAVCYKSLLGMIDGLDPEKEGIRKTPARAAEALQYFTKGYQQNLIGITNVLSRGVLVGIRCFTCNVDCCPWFVVVVVHLQK